MSAAFSQGVIVWFTGLSGSGKTTLCRCVARALEGSGSRVAVLDGDEMRATLSADLGFGRADREENVRRMAALAGREARAGAVVLVAAIAPYRELRQQIREGSPVKFVEVFVDAPLAVCEARDPKGLYRRARAGGLRDFTGVDAVYEAPLRPEVHCRTGEESVEESCRLVVRALGFEVGAGRLA